MSSPSTDTKGPIKGIDVSHYQGVIDWKKVRDDGYKFAFLKASEGVDLVDDTFAVNRRAAREAGLYTGYYHFFRPEDPVDAQVSLFVRTVQKLETNSLRPVLDCEDPRLWKKYTVQQRVAMVVDWCQKVKSALGVTPMLYGSPNFFTEILGSAPQLAAYDLWIANYNVAAPLVPKPWNQWTFWQSSEKGAVAGISGEVDINSFNGNDLSNSRSIEANNGEGSESAGKSPLTVFKLLLLIALLTMAMAALKQVL